ncbi:putative ribonuclease H-like domain-containing protein [Tanacetum coccineum]
MASFGRIYIFDFSRDDENDGSSADINNLIQTIQVSPIPTTRIHKDHPLDQVIGDLQSATQTRKTSKNLEEHGTQKDNSLMHEGLRSWIEAMHEELVQFKLQEVWTLVDLPNGKRAIGSKWGLRNKKDEKGIVIRNKARLVAQRYTQEEGIDYDKVFAPVARIEAIRLFLAYASFKDFVVYQMDVKSVFLYGKIKELGYVTPGAWYETLPTYLLDNGFQRGKFDKALFIKRYKGDILLVQVYVDDIIFGSTKKELCIAFKKLMHEKFQMSSMGELTFFLGLQVKQKNDGIFISQDKYVEEILKKFRFTKVKTTSTPMETQKPLLKDEDGKEVDVHMYRSMIGSLMYLTSSRPDIMFVVCVCARYQVNLKVSHLHVVKRIFSARNRQWLQIPQQKLSMWLLQVAVDKCFGFRINYLIMGKAKKSVKLMMEKLFRMELELMLVTQSGGPKCQETIGDTIAQTRFENASKHSNDSLLARASLGEDAFKHGRIDAIDADEEITLVSVQNMDKEMFDVNVLDGEEVFVAEQEVFVKDASNVVSTAGDATIVSDATTTTATITTVDDITLAQALMEIKSTKPKEKGDKGKRIMIEPVKPIKKKDQIRLDEEAALKLQAEFDEEERLAREKAEKEANIALIETWDDIQAKIDADHQLAERLKAQEQEELSIEEKATLFQQLLEKRRKHFAAKRA